ncbi:MAG: TadE/TadG family type IV pilus assembly protein [Pseudolabrys sp.]
MLEKAAMLMRAKFKAAIAAGWQRTRGVTKRFARNQDATAAVEFGLVALPFFALLFAIIQTALVFLANQTLEAAVSSAGRLIMTGQAQIANYNQQDFKNAVCKQVVAMFDCAGGVSVSVQKYASFAATSTTPPVQNGQLNTTMPYDAGGPGDIVVVQLYYLWPITVSLLGDNLSNMGSNRLLVATSAFRNEPYD